VSADIAPGARNWRHAHRLRSTADDLAEADQRVVALGATPLGGDQVYADPAGHPFCLINHPPWASPIRPADS
jgi:Glyoxalase-like domain